MQNKLFLQMWIGHVLVDRTEIEYEGMLSSAEKQQHQEKIACNLVEKHNVKIRESKEWPQFFIDNVPSKMNDDD